MPPAVVHTTRETQRHSRPPHRTHTVTFARFASGSSMWRRCTDNIMYRTNLVCANDIVNRQAGPIDRSIRLPVID